MLLAIGLHFYNLDSVGYGNLYYAATVKSMLTSPGNFFFGSFDPGGFVTVDKPPLGLWMQAISAMIFGFSGWSLIFPQALCGVLSVALVYGLVRRVFGPTAGLIAALVLAVTPISVAANRNNTMDSTLVFTLLLAAWAVSRAAESGRLGWLLLGAALVGVGFNVKMLQAFLVLPAFYVVYPFAPVAWWKRLIHLTLATIVIAAVSFAWVIAVDLVPPDQRPFIGSSHNNTVMELIVGHNGLARLMSPGRGGQPPEPPGSQPRLNDQPGQPPPNGQPGQPPTFNGPNNPPTPGGQPGQPGQPGGLMNETGERGVFRLFNEQLAGQASWLLPLAALGWLAAALGTRLMFPLQRQHQALLLWGMWLLTQVVFFSIAGLFHRYYLEMMSPAIAALVGAGVAAMWEDYRRASARGWLLPIAFIGTAAVEVLILMYFPGWALWLAPLLIVFTAASVIGLIVFRFIGQRACSTLAVTVGMLALLIAPTVWSLTPVLSAGDFGLPYAGPDLLIRKSAGVPNVNRLVEYLQSHRTGETFLAATVNANGAAPIILATGEPVMAMGGFTGRDEILSVDQLAHRVAGGDVRFFLVPAGREGGSELTHWVTEHCAPVLSDDWSSQSGGGGPSNWGPGGTPQLFDCRS